MGETEYSRALTVIKSLDISVPEPDQLLSQRKKMLALPNSGHHAQAWQEAKALRKFLFLVQQAYINTAYIRRLAMIDAVTQTTVISGRQETIEYINTVCLSHDMICPQLPPTKWRGIAALGILRIETDQEAREKAIILLHECDETALTIFNDYQSLYDGDQPRREAKAINDLLIDYRKDRKSREFVINGLMDLPPEFLQLWEEKLH